MAILNNLLVKSSSRFLNTAYFQDVSIAGTASLASLSLSGNLSVGGNATVSGTLGVTGEATFSNVAVFSKVGQSTATWNNPALVVGGTADQKHLELCNDTIQGKNNKNTTNNLYLNYYGSNVYLAGSKIYAIRDSTFVAPTANIVTVNAQNVNVTNNLRATHFDLQTVAQLGGSFYVSPTVKFPNSGTTLTVAKSDSTLTLTITDSSITSTTMAGIVWAANSRVKVSGTINGVVTGTMDGTVSSINTSSHVLTLSVSGENSASVVAGSYTASQFSDLTVMIYQRRDGSNDYRVGIWMNCYDIANSSSTIRIYGGSDANPNVMLGNLTSAGLGTVNNLTPTGWGLFAQNAFLHGKVVANGGLIGNWTIGTTGMYYDSDAPGSTSITMIPGGTTASTTSIGGSSGSKSWIFTGKNLFGIDTDGKLYASSAEISGKITANSGKIGKYSITDSYLLTYQNPNNQTSETCTGFGGQQAFWAGNELSNNAPFRVSYSGELVATSATITGDITVNTGYIGGTSGWTIASQQLSNGTLGADNSLYLGTKNLGSNTSIAGRKGSDWRLTVGSHFGVTNTGAIYATSGQIGGWTISGNYLYTGTWGANNSAMLCTGTASAKSIGGSGSISGWVFTAGANFGVTKTGALYASSANISGTLNAGANSQIGPWTVSDESIYKVSSDFGNTTSGAAYFGNNGLSIGGLVKIDARSGASTLISLGNSSSSSIDISSNGLIIKDKGTSMATFNSDGIEMRGSDGQILLDINTTGDAVTSSDSVGFGMTSPFESGVTYTFDLNNNNFDNFVGNLSITISVTNSSNTTTSQTYTCSPNEDYTATYSGLYATIHYYYQQKRISVTYNAVFGSGLTVSLDVSWNYTQYQHNYTFGTRSNYNTRGIGSMAIGKNLINRNDNALAIGRYNKDDNFLFAVGNGDSDSNRSNAFTVDNYGVVGFSGVAMFGDPGSTFYVGSYVVVNNASVASQSYKEGTRTIELAGYYPLCVAGYNSNTRYLTPVRFYLSDQQSGSASLHYMIFNPTSSARTGTCTMWVMWVKTT